MEGEISLILQTSKLDGNYKLEGREDIHFVSYEHGTALSQEQKEGQCISMS